MHSGVHRLRMQEVLVPMPNTTSNNISNSRVVPVSSEHTFPDPYSLPEIVDRNEDCKQIYFPSH